LVKATPRWRPGARLAVLEICALGATLAVAHPARAQVRQDPGVASVAASPSDRDSWNHPVGSGTDRYALVGVTLGPAAGELPTVATVSFAGRAMTFLGGISNGAVVRVELWGLSDPPTGMQPVELRVTRATALVAGSVSFSGVDPAAPASAVFTEIGTSPVASVSVTSAPGEMVIDVYGSPDANPVASSGRTPNWSDRSGVSGACSSRSGSTTVTMAWERSGGSSEWSLAAVSLRARSNSDGGAPTDGGAPSDGGAASEAGVPDRVPADGSDGPPSLDARPPEGGTADAAAGNGDSQIDPDATGRRVEYQVGCSCRLDPRPPGASPLALLALLALLARRRR
jgi:MYXO-CTERM domain-containing protein